MSYPFTLSSHWTPFSRPIITFDPTLGFSVLAQDQEISLNEDHNTLAVLRTAELTTLGSRLGRLDESLDSSISFDTEDLFLTKDAAESCDLGDPSLRPDVNRASTTWQSAEGQGSFTNFEYGNEFFDGMADVLSNSGMMADLDGGQNFDFATALSDFTPYVSFRHLFIVQD